jgi:hypothetical protein
MIGQPTLLPEGTYTDAELAFIELSPPGLWPENQDSNFGQTRKVLMDIVQSCIDEIDHLGEEMFVSTASEYLSLWEDIVRVPIAPVGKTDAQRRAIIKPRLQYGPFTRSRVRSIVEGFIMPTFGDALSFTPSGLSLSAGGLSMLSGVSSLVGAYRVYEDVRAYAYAVWIKSSITPDIPSLLKELQRVTPAGIAVTIDNSKANALSYFRTVRNKQPVWYSRLDGNANDASGYGNNGTLVGAPPAVASPGLLVATGNDDTAAYDLDGATQYMTIPHAAQLNVGNQFSLEMWVRGDSGGAVGRLYDKGTGTLSLYTDSGGVYLQSRAVANIAVSTIALTAATVYHLVVTYDGVNAKIWINAVDRTGAVTPQVLTDTATVARVGANQAGGEFFNGPIDEVALYNEVLTPAQVLENYNAGKNIQS